MTNLKVNVFNLKESKSYNIFIPVSLEEVELKTIKGEIKAEEEINKFLASESELQDTVLTINYISYGKH